MLGVAVEGDVLQIMCSIIMHGTNYNDIIVDVVEDLQLNQNVITDVEVIILLPRAVVLEADIIGG